MHWLENFAFIWEWCEEVKVQVSNLVANILWKTKELISLVKTLTIVTLSWLKEIKMERLLDQWYRRWLRLKHKKTNLNKK